MHYDSRYNPKKRTTDGDLFADGTRIQTAPSVQYPATRLLSDRVPAATALMGYDASRIDLEGYDWTAGG